jgi:GxxExxY protein
VTLDEGFRTDLIVEGHLLIEVKSVERFAPVHGKQVLTYLRLMNLSLGLLMNFGTVTFRDGLKRIANDYYGDSFR